MTARDRWLESLAPSGLEDPALRVFSELESLYSGGTRKYHDLRHVLDCLRHLAEHPVPDADGASLELAIWFHDAVYSPWRSDNELASADLASDRLGRMGAGDALRGKVRRLVLATTHREEPRDLDEAIMVDVDLAILGSNPDTYDAFETAIRSEYRFVPGPLFRRRRRALLESFLARPEIYRTEPFRRRFEATARENLRRAISRL